MSIVISDENSKEFEKRATRGTFEKILTHYTVENLAKKENWIHSGVLYFLLSFLWKLLEYFSHSLSQWYSHRVQQHSPWRMVWENDGWIRINHEWKIDLDQMRWHTLVQVVACEEKVAEWRIVTVDERKEITQKMVLEWHSQEKRLPVQNSHVQPMPSQSERMHSQMP